ncbi:hypothetical protein DL764_003513 [Monosporascus ibericus]|uniref:Major facilitator superfamily (MFS) profile domain-containing protein n=1 Tax=Monosporascus ibericus TaxID=155417 RepID=A0A4Q4TJV0_9PEZI|nr:hypothetical protein DL764_003513 [Monosporascus ibericus]
MSEKIGKGLDGSSSASPVNPPSAPAATTDIRSTERHTRLDKLEREHQCTWDGITDPQDPYNWSWTRKLMIGIVFSLGQFVTLLSASMMAAALGDISRDLGINASTAQISFSGYFLGLGFAPFLIAPISEMTGRKYIWLFCNGWYVLWNALCPVGKLTGLMIFGRLMTGVGAAAGVTLTGPVMADMYGPEERGKSLAIASFLPYFGPAVGPIVGGLLTQEVAWPWLFWTTSIFNAAVTVLGLTCIRETYAPVLLRRKLASIRAVEGEPSLKPWTAAFWSDFLPKLSVHLLRPVRMLVRRPVIQVISLVLAINFGTYTLMLSTFATLWIDRYHQTEAISSLHYIAIAIGTTVATQFGGFFMDRIYKFLRDRANGQSKPEFRAPCMIPGVVLMPAGLFWYGWASEDTVPWVVVDIGAAVFTAGSFILAQASLAYLLDEFTEHGASANASSRMFSYVVGFAFPIFAPQLYAQLGYGWGNSLLAFLFVLLGCPVPLIVWFWGEKLRGLGKRSAER